jgi:hypothetical protein
VIPPGIRSTGHCSCQSLGPPGKGHVDPIGLKRGCVRQAATQSKQRRSVIISNPLPHVIGDLLGSVQDFFRNITRKYFRSSLIFMAPFGSMCVIDWTELLKYQEELWVIDFAQFHCSSVAGLGHLTKIRALYCYPDPVRGLKPNHFGSVVTATRTHHRGETLWLPPIRADRRIATGAANARMAAFGRSHPVTTTEWSKPPLSAAWVGAGARCPSAGPGVRPGEQPRPGGCPAAPRVRSLSREDRRYLCCAIPRKLPRRDLRDEHPGPESRLGKGRGYFAGRGTRT